MATPEAQARWRARDPKHTIEVRLTPAAVSRLDNLVARSNAKGRAEVIERLLMAEPGEHPGAFLNEAMRLARSFFEATGTREAALRDSAGNVYQVKIE
ncbi:MAG TPA: ribbon-helix-helix protein, CopG family [Chromatiaceae bacterium]|jgi:hypothetical protein|nr:MAG: hypothetical protein N838_09555 [Thiohalocapsa sp. PB-PSB1]HBG95411.1 ribbon-helix-helix protein, CopG family [Chromatiaceae bacterium]HCS90907.1 ribbon-helix-helix protein, CopG family [Chromatiaceae bacterium]